MCHFHLSVPLRPALLVVPVALPIIRDGRLPEGSIPNGEKTLEECVLCLRTAGKSFWIPVAQNANATAALANHQRSRGALLVVPKRHSSTIAGLTVAEATDLYRLVRQMMVVLTRTFEPDGINVWQGGRMPEPKYDHVHTHVCPRFETDNSYSFAPSDDLPVPTKQERYAVADLVKVNVPAALAV